LPAEAITHQLNADCDVRRRFVTTSCWTHVRTVGHSAGFFGVGTVSIFPSVNEMMPTSLDEYFHQHFQMAESCIAAQFWSMAILSANISENGVAMRLRCGGIFN